MKEQLHSMSTKLNKLEQTVKTKVIHKVFFQR